MPANPTRRRFLMTAGAAGTGLLAGCTNIDGNGGGGETPTETDDSSMNDGMATPADPENAEQVTVDRFSEAAGILMVRTEENGLPGPGEPVDFDQAPFLTHGLGPDGGMATYYNFDVQPTAPAPIFVLFREGESKPVADQRNIVDVVPGDEGYNDFWHVHKVTVPEDYVANSATSLQHVSEAEYEITETDMLVNCPVVPEGSTASMRHGDGSTSLVDGWYQGKVVSYFEFVEAPLTVSDGSVPLSPIYVTFNENPGEDGGGPPSGFKTETGSDQTHNVVATLPGDDGYSPLWLVNIYDNADFDDVSDLESATDANQLASGAAMVNCPIVATGEREMSS